MNLPVLPSRPTCRSCPLHQTVQSVGIAAEWLDTSLPFAPGVPVLIALGRNPGANEDAQNRPFIGRSGKVLREGYFASGDPPLITLAHIQLHNLVKCFTVANAEPNFSKHVKPCAPHFFSDLEETLRCCSLPQENLNNSGNSGGRSNSYAPPMSATSPTGSSASQQTAVICLGGLASQAFVHLGLGEPKPKSQAECFKNNAREVKWHGHDLFLLHTFHPSMYLRNPNVGQAIQDHMMLLTDWFQGKLVAPSEPVLVPPRFPK